MASDTITATLDGYIASGIVPEGEIPLASISRLMMNASNEVVLSTDSAGNLIFPDGLATSVWAAGFTYAVGDIVRGSDGNSYRALTATADHNPTTDVGTNWELFQVVADVTLAIPSRFTTLALAWAFLRNARIGSTVTATIQFADGTYTFTTRATYNHPNGDRIAIMGNTTAAANCVLSATGLTSPGTGYLAKTDGLISVSDGHTLGLLDGFKIIGPGVATSTRLCGLLAFNGARIICGAHLWVTDWSLCIAAVNGSYISCDACRVSNGGDGNLFVYNGSAMSAAACTSEGASTNFAKAGAMVEHGSALFAPGSTFRNNEGAQVACNWNSTVMIKDSTLLASGGLTGAAGVTSFGCNSLDLTGVTYTGTTRYQGVIRTEATGNTYGGTRFGYDSSSAYNVFGAFHFIRPGTTLSTLSISQDTVATLFLGFAASSSLAVVANDGAQIDVKVGSSAALGGTTSASFTAKGFTPTILASDPASPVEGLIYYNSATHHWMGYNGTTFVQLDN